jgi:hypothetical protein
MDNLQLAGFSMYLQDGTAASGKTRLSVCVYLSITAGSPGPFPVAWGLFWPAMNSKLDKWQYSKQEWVDGEFTHQAWLSLSLQCPRAKNDIRSLRDAHSNRQPASLPTTFSTSHMAKWTARKGKVEQRVRIKKEKGPCHRRCKISNMFTSTRHPAWLAK